MGRGEREGGWVKIHRQIRSSELFRSLTAEQRSVFLSILLLANWKDQKALLGGAWVSIRRGELAHSLSTIAEEAAVTVKVVRSTIAKLLADDSPAGGRGPFLGARWTGTAPGTGLRVLSVLRYEEYQGDAEEEGTRPGRVGARQGHGQGTTGAPREEGKEGEALEEPPAAPAAPPARGGGRKAGKDTDPRHRPLQERLLATFEEIRGTPYALGGGKDAKGIADLLRFADGDPGEVDRRWRLALGLGSKWPGCASLAGLASRWNELASAEVGRSTKWPQETREVQLDGPPLWRRLLAAHDALPPDQQWSGLHELRPREIDGELVLLASDPQRADGLTRLGWPEKLSALVGARVSIRATPPPAPRLGSAAPAPAWAFGQGGQRAIEP